MVNPVAPAGQVTADDAATDIGRPRLVSQHANQIPRGGPQAAPALFADAAAIHSRRHPAALMPSSLMPAALRRRTPTP